VTKHQDEWVGIPPKAFHPRAFDEYAEGFIGLRRLRDITVTSVLTSRQLARLENHVIQGDTIWFEIPGSNPPVEVQCIVMEVKRADGRVTSLTARPTGRPRHIRRTQ